MQWSLDTGKAIGPPLTDLGSEVTSLAMDPSGKFLAAGSADAVRLLEITGAKPVAHLLESTLQGVWSLAISHDRATLAAGGSTGNIILWDTKTNRQKRVPLKTDETGITRLFFSPDDQLLGAVSKDRIVFWNIATGEEVDRLVEDDAISDAIFDQAGARLATGTFSGAINVWDWPRLKRRGERLASHGGGVLSLAFGPDDQSLFSSGADRTFIRHELSTDPPNSTPLEGYDVSRIACSTEGKVYALGNSDGSISIYDASLQPISTQKYHKADIRELTLSPDGKLLASTSEDRLGQNAIRIFDVVARQVISSPLIGHKANITGIVFGDQGKTMFSADEAGVILRWDLDVDSWQSLAASLAGRGITKDEAKEYLDEDSPPPVSDAQTLLKRADVATLKKEPDAKALFSEAVKAAITSKDPAVSNSVCWLGSVDGFADVVLPAGDRAVDVADQASKGYYCDTRGLARALVGRRQEAIEDFRAFISWAERNNLQHDRVSKRQEWIHKLEKGEQPFTSEVLLDLRNEAIAFALD